MLEAACLVTAGLAGAEENYDESTLEAAHRRYRGSMRAPGTLAGGRLGQRLHGA